MKLSVSLSDSDIAILDAYVREAHLASRSAALQHAVALLKHVHLEREYAQAWDEWTATDEGVWSSTTADGLDA